MKWPQQDSVTQSPKAADIRAPSVLDLVRTANWRTLTLAGVAVAFAWIPPTLLCAFGGGGALLSFLTDYASLSRFLVVVPILILAEAPLRARLTVVVKHFEQFLVPHHQHAAFRGSWESCKNLQDSKLGRLLLVLLTYATVLWLEQHLSPGGAEFVSWWNGSTAFRFFSPAGVWVLFVSYPILLYLTLLWLWRQLIWTRFLRSITRLNLRLIAAHPDHLGGLGFIEASLRGQVFFSFCLGVGLAGAIANRVINEGHKLWEFRHMALVLIGAVLLICVAPYCTFIGTLMRMRRRGMLGYGAFARAVGEQFKKKWLHQAGSLDAEVLSVPDFSTTTDLYGMAANINKIRVIPVGTIDIYALIGSALLPTIPVVIASIPFDTVMKSAMKLMF